MILIAMFVYPANSDSNDISDDGEEEKKVEDGAIEAKDGNEKIVAKEISSDSSN